MKRTLVVLAAVATVIVLAIGLAFLLPATGAIYDFIILYSASLGVIHRIPLYDNAAITALTIAKLSAPAGFSLFPYPYPPWYAVSTFYLGFLPLAVAATSWRLLNVAMLVASIVLLTEAWQPVWRILAALAGVLFVPSLGLLVVGQYSVPVLLGAAVFIYAVHHQDAPFTAIGLLLMTFKPHIGLFLFPAAFFWLTFQKAVFARRAIWLTLGGALVLFVLGFIADPGWPLTYLHSMISFSSIPSVANRNISASFPVLLMKLITGQSGTIWVTVLSLVFAIGLAVLFWRWKVVTNVRLLITCCVLMTLLADPYLSNYDYVLLLLPLILLAEWGRSLAMRLAVVAIYLLPGISLVLGRSGDIFYPLSAILLVLLILRNNPQAEPVLATA